MATSSKLEVVILSHISALGCPSRNGDVYGCGSNRNGQLPCMAPALEPPSSDSAMSEGSTSVKEGTTGGGSGTTCTSYASATAAPDSVYEPTLLRLSFVDQHQVSYDCCCCCSNC